MMFQELLLLGILAASQAQPIERIDLNKASLEELVRLPGLGEIRARAIIDERTRRPFRRFAELLRIRGIGRKRLRKWIPYLTIRRPLDQGSVQESVP